MNGLKQRAKTLGELAESALFYVRPRPLTPNDAARKLLGADAVGRLAKLRPVLEGVADWRSALIEAAVRDAAAAAGVKLGDLAQPLRAALAGQTTSPPIFEVMEVLGRAETLGRLADAAGPV